MLGYEILGREDEYYGKPLTGRATLVSKSYKWVGCSSLYQIVLGNVGACESRITLASEVPCDARAPRASRAGNLGRRGTLRFSRQRNI